MTKQVKYVSNKSDKTNSLHGGKEKVWKACGTRQLYQCHLSISLEVKLRMYTGELVGILRAAKDEVKCFSII